MWTLRDTGLIVGSGVGEGSASIGVGDGVTVGVYVLGASVATIGLANATD